MGEDVRTTGFKDRTRIGAARDRLLGVVSPHGRTEQVPLIDADGRALAGAVTADRPVPHYARAAMDGYAVRAADTFGASDQSPAILRSGERVGPETAVRVHTGSELPDRADAVVMIEQVEVIGPDGPGAELEVYDAVAEGENVGAVGEDVEAGRTLYEPPHTLRPSDLGLCKAVGIESLEVTQRPRVSVIPTGEELVQADPAPGEVIETNGQTVTQLAERWGADATYRSVVTDDRTALREAIERNLDHDAVVTTGGSSVGDRDLVPTVVADLGEVLVHGVALKPGHPVALGVVDETPILMLPGYPVACIVNAVEFLRPVVKTLGGYPRTDHPAVEARLSRKIVSEPGTRTYARVSLDTDGDEPEAEPTRASGAGVLSSVALADGWVVVPEGREGIDAGTTVSVQLWEWSA